jgi:RNA ligase
MFPYIQHIDQLKEKVGHMKEIRFMEQENGFTVVCYMISDKDTFHGENAWWARECRGITFDRNGNIVSRPLHKFFNIGECEETRLENLDWNKIVATLDKRDGSMVHPVLVDGNVCFKSKKSFTSDVALAANKFADVNKNYYQFSDSLLKAGLTPTFEYTAPNSRIVINYGSEPQMKLLHVRNTYSGKYFLAGMDIEEEEFVHNLISKFNIELIDQVNSEMTNQELVKNLETVEGIEGYIFQFADGNMVKAKSKWYLELHKTIVFLRERDIAELVLDEKIDDIKSMIDDVLQLEKINKIEHDVKMKILQISDAVEKMFKENAHLSRKDFAIKFKNSDMFSLLMKRYLTADIDYVSFFKKNYLHEYSLEQI